MYNSKWISFFSYEKTLTVDPVYNKQNNLVVCIGKADNSIRTVTKTKNPASVVMFGVVASTGEKITPIGFLLDTGYSRGTT
uniref:Uncharacterized protein n=1 Tax=Lepeophtheirus salmonis TaxID=72036 RepID=A0A0K2UAG9_LEPSM